MYLYYYINKYEYVWIYIYEFEYVCIYIYIFMHIDVFTGAWQAACNTKRGRVRLCCLRCQSPECFSRFDVAEVVVKVFLKDVRACANCNKMYRGCKDKREIQSKMQKKISRSFCLCNPIAQYCETHSTVSVQYCLQCIPAKRTLNTYIYSS